MKKTLISIALASLSTAALADPFYINNGVDFSALDSGQVNATSTGLKNQITYQYESISTVIDLDNNGIDAGDTVLTTGGINPPGTLGNNNFTGFTPNQLVNGSNSNNGYNALGAWSMTFGITGLQGTIVNYVAGVDLDIAYGPAGLIEFYYIDPANPSADIAGDTNHFMDIDVTGALTVGPGILLTGDVDFSGTNQTSLTAGGTLMRDLFHSGTAACAGNDSFFAIATNCGTTMSIEFLADFNTNAATIGITDNGIGVDGLRTFTLAGNHDGSGVFNNVPEPEMLALMGGAFLMFGAARRNRKA